MQPAVDVSVIICTRNRADRLLTATAAVQASMDKAEETGLACQLLTVDNNSEDHTRGIVEDLARQDPRVHYVLAPIQGIGRARSAGISAAQGKAILFTDDDTRVPAHWIIEMTRPLRSGEADVVSGGIKMADDLRRPWMTEDLRSKYYADVPLPPDVNPGLAGANMGFTCEVGLRLGFDEMLGTPQYPGAEDVIFYVQALEAGYRVRGVQGACVTHHFDPSRLEHPHLQRQAKGYGRCDAYYYHHWLHASFAHQRLRLFAHRARLLLRRIHAVGRPHHPALVQAIRTVACHEEMLRLRDGPRRYVLRGLTLVE